MSKFKETVVEDTANEMFDLMMSKLLDRMCNSGEYESSEQIESEADRVIVLALERMKEIINTIYPAAAISRGIVGR